LITADNFEDGRLVWRFNEGPNLAGDRAYGVSKRSLNKRQSLIKVGNVDDLQAQKFVLGNG
jgi:hypothetical protein